MGKTKSPARNAATEKRPTRYWGNAAMPKSRAEFFNAVTTPAPTGDSTVATIRMYGPIDSWGGWWGISTEDVGQVLDALPDSVTQIVLRINSPGGEVFEAVSILNMLRAHKASVTAVVDGLAASAASFIAAGCDETVMSPGTQMMIHSPLQMVYGNAPELRKYADILDGLESSIVEIYTDKAGQKDWAELLADETWMTAAETVELGLADRVAVIPDAGNASTIADTEDELEVFLPAEEDDVEDLAALMRAARFPERLTARAHILPSSSEPGAPRKKEKADMAYKDLTAGLRDRLGVTEADATDEQLLAAVDAVLAQPNTVAPAGTTLIDATVLESLQNDAAAGREARAQQDDDRRDGIVNRALAEGRIAPANRATWLAQLVADEKGTTALLATLPKNTVPVTLIGISDDISAEDSLYAAAFGDEKEV